MNQLEFQNLLRAYLNESQNRNPSYSIRAFAKRIGMGFGILDRVADQALDGKHSPSFFRIMFHEVLVQAGLEKPLASEVPSEYPIASRLDVHLETFEEWVPGRNQNGKTPGFCKVTIRSWDDSPLRMKLKYGSYFLPHDDIYVGSFNSVESCVCAAKESGLDRYAGIWSLKKIRVEFTDQSLKTSSFFQRTDDLEKAVGSLKEKGFCRTQTQWLTYFKDYIKNQKEEELKRQNALRR